MRAATQHQGRYLRLGLCALLLSFSAVAQAPLEVRVALVIGNAAYPGRAALTNPVNDATAMSDILRRLGFKVIEVRDARREQMNQAIVQTQAALQGKQGVALLYYAGHGVQLDWRNYMVPIDARLEKSADIPRQAVDIDQVLSAFKNAGTRMNILVLDACRDNPFTEQSTGRGLSQLDAPPGTYLAFATSPGNVAADADAGGAHGLYTRFLLQELQQPARIEDVFKRVRLHVRKQSQGKQIPWDSSSLEEDFYFNDGIKYTLKPTQTEAQQLALVQAQAEQKRLSIEAAREAAFTREKADWDRIKNTRDANDIYAYLQKYPTGLISEQAHAALEKLAKPQIVMQADKNGIVQQPGQSRFRIGDMHVTLVRNGFNDVELRKGTQRVDAISNDRAIINQSGRNPIIRSLNGDLYEGVGASGRITYDPPLVIFPSGELQVGKKWVGRTVETTPSGKYKRDDVYKITALEDITIAAGTFKAFKVENEAFREDGIHVVNIYWLLPDWGFPIKSEVEVRTRRGQYLLWEKREMFSQKRGAG